MSELHSNNENTEQEEVTSISAEPSTEKPQEPAKNQDYTYPPRVFDPTEAEPEIPNREIGSQIRELPHPTEEEYFETRESVYKKITNPEYTWGGLNTSEAILYKFCSAMRALNGNTAPEEINNQKRIQQAIDNLKGELGERVACAIPIDKAETVFCGENVDPELVKSLEIVDVAKVFGNTRKDKIIRNYYYSQMESAPYINRALQSLGIEVNEKTRQAATNVLHNLSTMEGQFDTNQKKWRRDDPRFPEFAKEALEVANAMASNTATDEQAAKLSIFNKITVPDALLTSTTIMENGQPLTTYDGIIEVKTYKPKEVRALTAALEQDERYGVLKEPVNVDGKEMTLGLDVEGETTFVNIAGKMDYENINFKPQGGYLVILRFPEDIPTDDLYDLGQAIRHKGFSNFIIQTIPVDTEEIISIAPKLVEKAFQPLEVDFGKRGSYARRLTKGSENIELNVLKSLTRPETWQTQQTEEVL